jgi:hypothetical protein
MYVSRFEFLYLETRIQLLLTYIFNFLKSRLIVKWLNKYNLSEFVYRCLLISSTRHFVSLRQI